MGDDPAVRGDDATQEWKDLGDDRLPIRYCRRRRRATEERFAAARLVRLDELTHLIDVPDAIQVALFLRLPPGEQAVTAEDQPVGARRALDRALQHQGQLEAGPLPRHPQDLSPVLTIEFLELALAIRTGRQSDRPVGMQVIDMRERKKCMQRRIDRSGDAIFAKRAEWIKRDHLVFERLAAIARNQAVQLVHVEDREAAVGDRAQISTAAL